MRILLIHNYYQYRGGEDIYFESLKNLLVKNGHEVYLYTKDSINIVTLQDKLRVVFGFLNNRVVNKEIHEIILNFKPEVAHIHNIYPMITPSIYKILKRYKIRIIQRVANYRLICPKGILYRNNKICELCVKKHSYFPAIFYKCYRNSFLETFTLASSLYYHRLIKSFNFVDKFVFQTEFVKNKIREAFFIPKEKIAIVPHFVPEIDTKIAKNKDDFFVYAGRLSEEKGILMLLDSFKELKSIKLLVIGDGPLQKEILKKHKKYKNIFIKGKINRKKTLYYMSKAKAVIIPSLSYETGPLVLMEAFSVGTPVIVPNIGVFKKQIKKGAVFFKYNNSQSLKKSILFFAQLNKNPANTRLYLKKGINSNYTEKKHYLKLEKIYFLKE